MCTAGVDYTITMTDEMRWGTEAAGLRRDPIARCGPVSLVGEMPRRDVEMACAVCLVGP